ncbi:MAG: amidase domain-containing protein [Bacilli bacterium]|nr:amidase domain-containing protein [Bacilli bacterium]
MKRSMGNKLILIALMILLSLTIYALYKNNVIEIPKTNDNNINNTKDGGKDTIEDPKPENKVGEQTTYLGEVSNSSNTTIKEGWQDVIVKFLDAYTKSLVNLNTEDVTNLFTDPSGNEAYLTEATIDFQVEHHKLQPNDMKLSYASYNIEYKSVNISGNKVTIVFLEDDFYKFNFMNDITSRVIDVENTIVINKNEDETYSIDSLRVVRDNYVMFTNAVEIGSSNAKATIDNLKAKYIGWAKEEVANNKKLLEEANSNEYVAKKTCDNGYNRDAAISYANKYADGRNSDYYDYSDLGGNCANYGSQSVYAGGIPMDYSGTYQWKYYGTGLNDSNTATGRSNSWTSTNYFYNYAKNNTGYGMCADVDVNIFYAEGGDIIQVGYSGYTHTTIVVGVAKKDNKILDIIVNSNTVGLENYPVLGYTYQNKRLIKILGYND